MHYKKSIMENTNNRIGEIHTTNEGCKLEIIEYFGVNNCTIKFDDWNNTIMENICYHNIIKGGVKNPYHKSVYGVGYIGSRIKNKKGERKMYKTWVGMLERGYSEKLKSVRPTYIGITVCDEWHNFENFKKWFQVNYNPEIMQGWDLDKDIICSECKVYSPETCAFVPQEINKLFIDRLTDKGYRITKNKKYEVRLNKEKSRVQIGTFNTPEEAFQAYKTAKEQYIKEVADKWKGLISDKVYEAMYNYEVEITD